MIARPEKDKASGVNPSHPTPDFVPPARQTKRGVPTLQVDHTRERHGQFENFTIRQARPHLRDQATGSLLSAGQRVDETGDKIQGLFVVNLYGWLRKVPQIKAWIIPRPLHESFWPAAIVTVRHTVRQLPAEPALALRTSINQPLLSGWIIEIGRKDHMALT